MVSSSWNKASSKLMYEQVLGCLGCVNGSNKLFITLFDANLSRKKSEFIHAECEKIRRVGGVKFHSPLFVLLF